MPIAVIRSTSRSPRFRRAPLPSPTTRTAHSGSSITSLSGTGSVRHEEGVTAIEAGDAFVFRPNEPHQIRNDGDGDLVYYVIADNPVGESCHYPDSRKWAVKGPEYRLIRSEPLDYYDGEE